MCLLHCPLVFFSLFFFLSSSLCFVCSIHSLRIYRSLVFLVSFSSCHFFFFSVGRFDEPLFQRKPFSMDKNLALLEWRCVCKRFCACALHTITLYNTAIAFSSSCRQDCAVYGERSTTKYDDDDDNDAPSKETFYHSIVVCSYDVDSEKNTLSPSIHFDV